MRNSRTASRIVALAVAMLLSGVLPVVHAGAQGGGPPDFVPFGGEGTLPGYELTVLNVDGNAEELLHTFDPSMPYLTDTAYVMVQMEARNTGQVDSAPGEALSFILVLDEAYVLDLSTSGCDDWPMPPDAITLAPGETARFNLCFMAPLWLPLDDHANLVVHSNLQSDPRPRIFSLDGHARYRSQRLHTNAQTTVRLPATGRGWALADSCLNLNPDRQCSRHGGGRLQ